jgi:glycerol-3-phosphate dehydrogenase
LYEEVHDLAIIGGGLIGSAIARDAAGRGLTTFLCEQGDIGGASTAATDRVVHGGLHHLGRMNWGALRMRLKERDILMRAAPHLVRPLTFVLPHHEGLWPPWALGLGFFAYDRLAGRAMPRARRLDLANRDADEALHLHFGQGFAFSDCLADDSRLAIANAFDAQSRGASVNPRLRCVVAERERDRWRLSLESQIDGEWTVVWRAC